MSTMYWNDWTARRLIPNNSWSQAEKYMTNALIGFSGFVGGTFLRQAGFDALFRSNTIQEIVDRRFDLVVCAGAPAKKWIANKDPEGDLRNLENLMSCLKTIDCRQFVLISTVDVFSDPVGVNEDTAVVDFGNHAYGRNRRELERFVQEKYPQSLIVRLPGLVGPGLRKNAVYDLLHNNNLEQIDCRSIYQFYPMVNLWFDIVSALNAGIRLLHLTAAPISIGDVSRDGFGRNFDHVGSGPIARYDMRTKHAAVFGGTGDYQYSARDTLQAIRCYVQSELSWHNSLP